MSFRQQPETGGEMFGLCRWQRLGEFVGDHFFCGARHEAEGSPAQSPNGSNDSARQCAGHGASMVLVVLRERDSGLVVRDYGGGLRDGAIELGDKASQPEGILHPVCRLDEKERM